jgi:pimeloyl-ACP methyl ester carboxylesterase
LGGSWTRASPSRSSNGRQWTTIEAKPNPGKSILVILGSMMCVIFLFGFGMVQFIAYHYIAMPFVGVYKDWAPPVSLTPATALDGLKREMCEHLRKTFSKHVQIEDVHEHFQDSDRWQAVRFPSQRHEDEEVETADLSAFFFPSQTRHKDDPTVVLVHGQNSNNRDHTVTVVAYFLTMMNFNVLALNLRNHGDSQDMGHITWAQDEYFDVLGAMDYLKNDPDGKLGQKKDDSEIALMGFGLGGYICRVVFGAHREVAGLLTDAAIWDVKEQLRYQMDHGSDSSYADWLFLRSAWYWVNRISNRNLEGLTPAEVYNLHWQLDRPQAVIHAVDDVAVPVHQARLFQEYLRDTKQTLNNSMEWYPTTAKEIASRFECAPHCKTHLAHPVLYQQFLCIFFSTVFDRSPSKCGLGDKDVWFDDALQVFRRDSLPRRSGVA